MGCAVSKCKEEKQQMRETIQLLEEKMRQNNRKREEESMVHKLEEEEWKEEKKRFYFEYEALKKKLEEEEERRKRHAMVVAVEEMASDEEKIDNGWFLVKEMRMEQTRREDAVEKWKQLYHAIKSELDELISRTGQGNNLLYWGTNEEVIDVLQRELTTREEMLEVLKVQLMAMEKEGIKRDREIDILRQSVRILYGGIKLVTPEKNMSKKKLYS